MILSSKNKIDFFSCLDKIGLKERINKCQSVLIKVNLSQPYSKNHPKTDGKILSNVIEYIYLNQGNCTIAESANGYLRDNLEQSGLAKIINKYNVGVLDLDFEDVEEVTINDEKHYIPKCLRDFGVRVAIPATSKRPEMIFSNNVKLFVGAVPRRMYQIDGNHSAPRPRIHIDLHKSVANLFCAIQHYASFVNTAA